MEVKPAAKNICLDKARAGLIYHGRYAAADDDDYYYYIIIIIIAIIVI